jgi:hypothetical protein
VLSAILHRIAFSQLFLFHFCFLSIITRTRDGCCFFSSSAVQEKKKKKNRSFHLFYTSSSSLPPSKS